MQENCIRGPCCQILVGRTGRIWGKGALDVEAEEDNIPVLHHILLALRTNQALFLGGVHGAAGHQVGEVDHLGPDEAPLKVSVDLTGGLGGLGALLDGPGPALVLAGGEEGDQTQQGVAGLDEPVQAGLGDAQVVQDLPRALSL